MHGYMCDRCKKTHGGQSGTQRDPGPFPPTGWLEIPLTTKLHLCDECSTEFMAWLQGR